MTDKDTETKPRWDMEVWEIAKTRHISVENKPRLRHKKPCPETSWASITACNTASPGKSQNFKINTAATWLGMDRPLLYPTDRLYHSDYQQLTSAINTSDQKQFYHPSSVKANSNYTVVTMNFHDVSSCQLQHGVTCNVTARHKLLHINAYLHTHTHTRASVLRPFFRDHPGEPGNLLLDFYGAREDNNRATTPSGTTSGPSPLSAHFYAGWTSCHNPPTLSWLGTGTKYVGLHTLRLGLMHTYTSHNYIQIPGDRTTCLCFKRSFSRWTWIGWSSLFTASSSTCSGRERFQTSSTGFHALDALPPRSLGKILRIPYTGHLTNASVRETIGCPPVSSNTKTRWLRFFGHVARSDYRQHHQQAINASLHPPRDWRRPPGCPRTTWLRGIDADVQSANIGIHSAWRKANECVLWWRIIH